MEILFDYEVIKQLGKGKTGVSYLVKKSENYFVLKVMNQNVMDYEKQLEIFTRTDLWKSFRRTSSHIPE